MYDGGCVLDISFEAPGKRFLTVGTNRKVYVWDLQTKKTLRTFSFSERPGFAAFSPSGKSIIVTVRAPKALRLPIELPKRVVDRLPVAQWRVVECDLASGMKKTICGAKTEEIPVGFNVKSETVVLYGARPAPFNETHYYLKIRTIKSTKELVRVWKQPFNVMAFSQDHTRVALLFGNGLIRIVDLQTEQVLFAFQLDANADSGLAFLPDGNRFVAISKEESQILFFGNIAKKKIEPSRRLLYSLVGINGVSKDGRFVAFRWQQRLVAWDFKAGQAKQFAGIHPARWDIIEFSPCNTFLMAADARGNLYQFKIPAHDR
ncbi:MAG: WD40 repeat domain-containing protein [Planctomycetes bacterium]|nr:WD40 repeat domain-containing protein [Planctomycetota bacterium]